MENLENVQAEIAPRLRVRPWVRSWARFLDYCLLQVMGVFWAMVALHIDPHNKTLIIGMLSLYVLGSAFGAWIIFESLSFACFGTTPGKWFLKVRVSNLDGSSPNFTQALSRSVRLWFFGQGMMIPWLTYVPQAWAYLNLKRSHTTRWDEDTKLLVSHDPPGVFRFTVTVILTSIWVSVYGKFIKQLFATLH